jgi:hypothetical protein
LIAIAFSATLIYKLLQNNAKNQIISVTDETKVDVTNIYFPAITFCPSLIINTNHEKTIDYDAVTKALENHEIKIESLTLDE